MNETTVVCSSTVQGLLMRCSASIRRPASCFSTGSDTAAAERKCTGTAPVL